MHDRHEAAGAELTWVGDWRRPHHYTTPEAEVDAVRNRVGVIDVSALGKFRVEGPQAVTLLERLYPNRFDDLAVGGIRYGAMLNDEGVIVGDGAVVRLEDDDFFVTVTAGNTALERWITWWNADWQLDARIVDVTGAFGAVHVAGPRARSVMAALTEADVSGKAMPPSMRAARTDVAGVPSLVLRTGFVGELGYEIHFPSAYGEHVWDAVMEAGASVGIAPFGLEAQRILRLEKQHILIGRDTDAESDPFEVGLGWIVEEDKNDFLGLAALRALRDQGPRERLVGFTASHDWLPPEGASVMRDDRRVGRVTSARRSAAVGSVVGLAWVPAGLAEDGNTFEIRFGGTHTTATVRTAPFYDPEGSRLRA